MKRGHGFTLVELLVVVAIITVLLALLIPSLDKAIEVAQRAVCGTNLHTWGVGHAQYYMDHQRKLMEPVRLFADVQHGGDGWVYATHAWMWNQPDRAGRTGQWSAQAYAPYVSAVSYSSVPTRGPANVSNPAGDDVNTNVATGATVSKVFLCPSDVRFKDREERNNEVAQMPPGPTKATGDLAPDEGGPTVESHYAYFARVSKWKSSDGGTGAAAGSNRAPWPEELVDRDLAGNKLLMMDHIKLDSGAWQGNGSSYSHGELPEGGNAAIAGANQLYGDGGVSWYDQRYFNNPALSAANAYGTDISPGYRTDIPHYVNGAGVYGSNAFAPYFFYATSTR